MLTKEQFKEKWMDDLLEIVDQPVVDDSWRHGNSYITVFKEFEAFDGGERGETTEWRETGKFYAASYRVSGDGEYHGIREGEFEFWEVEPYTETITVTKYRKV